MFAFTSVLLLLLWQILATHVLGKGTPGKCVTTAEYTPQIIFSHIFKTGGSTVRQVLREYANECKYSLAVIVNCKRNSSLSVNTTTLPCRVKDTQLNGLRLMPKGSRQNMNRETPKLAHLKKFDMIAGHIPIGLSSALYDSAELPWGGLSTPVDQRRPRILITWIRHPLAMLASAALYSELNSLEVRRWKSSSVPVLLSRIESMVESPINRLSFMDAPEYQHSIYTKYLFPGGAAHGSKRSRTEFISEMEAMFKSFTVVGILENHANSIDMLATALSTANASSLKGKSRVPSADFWGEMRILQKNNVQLQINSRGQVFYQANGKPPHDKFKDSPSGVSSMSTGALVRHIQKNATLHELVSRRLSLEVELYQMAVDVHRTQCKQFKQVSLDLNCTF